MTHSGIVILCKKKDYRTHNYVLKNTIRTSKYVYAASYTIEPTPFVCITVHCNYKILRVYESVLKYTTINKNVSMFIINRYDQRIEKYFTIMFLFSSSTIINFKKNLNLAYSNRKLSNI